MPANDKLLRWIDLLCALLRRRYGVAFDELRHEVPAYTTGTEAAVMRAFERDKDELRKAGIAIETHRSDDGEPDTYRLLAKSFYLPYLVLTDAARPGPTLDAAIRRPTTGMGYAQLQPLALTPEEAIMLRRAAERLALLGEPRLNDDASQAFRKLRHDLPEAFPLPAVQSDASTAKSDASDRFASLAEAVHRRKQVTITYHTIGTGQTAPRTVEPFGLVYLTGNWYLVARDTSDTTLRHFRTSRISSVTVNTKQPNTADFTHPTGFDLRAHARSRHAWELGDADAETVDVRFYNHERIQFGEALPADDHDGPPDPDVRRFRVRRRDVFLRWVLAFAGDASPVAPDAVVQDWRALLAATHAAHAAHIARQTQHTSEHSV